MAIDTPYKQEFRIRDLGTRSVLLFPTRAQIIRDIKDIDLKPGLNRIIIDGLAPTVDEHSIKVEGTGAATISEVSVDLLPNRDSYEDIYPSDESSSEDDSPSEPESATLSLKAWNKQIKDLNVALIAEKEKINNAAKRLSICDTYGKSISTEHVVPDKVAEVLKVYNAEREKIFEDHTNAVKAVDKLDEDILEAEKARKKVAKDLVKVQLKEQKAKKKLKEKAIRKKAEAFKEKQRIKKERESFWAKQVYRITISLETSNTTPGSSRRSSITEGEVTNLATTTFHEPDSLKEGSISLSISYITYSASWSPRYDLNLSSLKCTGILEYGADLKNETSETWHDAKVILSTSQTTFSGLSEEIPTLHPWHIRLMKGIRNSDSGLMSQNELIMKRKEWTASTAHKPRHQMFGVENSVQTQYAEDATRKHVAKVQERGDKLDHLIPKTSNTSIQHARHQRSLFGTVSNAGASSLFGSGNAVTTGASGSFGNSNQGETRRYMAVSRAPRQRERVDFEKESDRECELPADNTSDDNNLQKQDADSLTFEEGAWEESGMTTTYDVPGLKTLGPSNSTIRHKIARVDFKNVIFSYESTPKLRQVGFLKARLRNASKITLLKGPLGLSLDGSFLGRASFPRCSAGETFSLPLGVDPAIQIAYLKPTVRRSQSGIFTKEDSNVFTRSITVTNTKNNSAIELTVLDQVPVSEDERLHIDIITPRGLKIGSESVRAGSDASSSAGTGVLNRNSAQSIRASAYGGENGKEFDKQVKWGSAEALAKKSGEITWKVKLNPGCSVKLALEYEATFPGGESVVEGRGV